MVNAIYGPRHIWSTPSIVNAIYGQGPLDGEFNLLSLILHENSRIVDTISSTEYEKDIARDKQVQISLFCLSTITKDCGKKHDFFVERPYYCPTSI